MDKLDKNERLSHSEKVVMREVYNLVEDVPDRRFQARELNKSLMKGYGWPRNANYVYIKRLQDKGFLIREEGRGYWLRPSMEFEELLTDMLEYWTDGFRAVDAELLCGVVLRVLQPDKQELDRIRAKIDAYAQSL